MKPEAFSIKRVWWSLSMRGLTVVSVSLTTTPAVGKHHLWLTLLGAPGLNHSNPDPCQADIEIYTKWWILFWGEEKNPTKQSRNKKMRPRIQNPLIMEEYENASQNSKPSDNGLKKILCFRFNPKCNLRQVFFSIWVISLALFGIQVH